MKCANYKTSERVNSTVDRPKVAPTSREQTPGFTERGWQQYLDGQVAALEVLNMEFQQQHAAFRHSILWRLRELHSKKALKKGLADVLNNSVDKVMHVEQIRQKLFNDMVGTILLLQQESTGIIPAIEEKERGRGEQW